MRTNNLHRAVRLTARTSAILFAAAQAASAMDRSSGRTAHRLYVAFMVAHALHFTVVTRYAVATGGRRLFPGGRDLHDVGGWRTVLGIYAAFAALALTGTEAISADPHAPWHGIAGPTATGLIAAMFVGTYLQQLSQSRWFAAPAIAIGTTTVANIVTAHRRATRDPGTTTQAALQW